MTLCASGCSGGPTQWCFTAAPAGLQSTSFLSICSGWKKFCAICRLPYSVSELVPLNIYPAYQNCTNLTNILNKLNFWDSLGWAFTVLNSICQAIFVGDINSFSIPTAFSCLLFIQVHYHRAERMGSIETPYLNPYLIGQARRMPSSMHYLAFRCDSFYNSMQTAAS